MRYLSPEDLAQKYVYTIGAFGAAMGLTPDEMLAFMKELKVQITEGIQEFESLEDYGGFEQ